MPELAEVAYYARLWTPGIGETVRRVHAAEKPRFFRDVSPAAVREGLAGRALLSVRTHGKNLLFGFSGGLWMAGHLGMTGELKTAPPDHEPDKHEHLALFTPNRALVFRDFRLFGGVRRFEETGDETLPPDWWRALPPEILSEGFTKERVAAALRRHAKTPLKPLLLDQAWFPGVGNWMADEVLFRLKLHPATPAGKADPAALRRVLRGVCRAALRIIGADWSDPPKSWLFQHRWRDGGACPRCAAPLKREVLRGRTACHCPVCQPAG